MVTKTYTETHVADLPNFILNYFLMIIHFHFQVYVQAVDTVTMEMTQEFITTATGSNKPYHIFVQLGNIELIQGKV